MGVQVQRRTKAIEDWFRAEARDLPWRRKRTRWRSFVSEIMLQQTQVSRVVEKFEPFMKLFPTPKALAEASEDSVNAAWAGLGYYRRARNLQAAAAQIVEHHGGRVPTKLDDLLELRGVGRYTAGAVASIACGKRAPIVDGNVHRVLSRLHADPFSLDDRDCAKRTWERADVMVRASSNPAVFNEGLMELGSQVCTKHSPLCTECPVKKGCQACVQDLVDQIPPVRKRIAKTVEHHHAVAIVRGNRFILQQRSSKGRWAGLWQLPTLESDKKLKPEDIRAGLGIKIEELKHLDSFERLLTHRRIRFHVYRAVMEPGTRIGSSGKWHFFSEEKWPPMGVAQRKTLEVLESCLKGA